MTDLRTTLPQIVMASAIAAAAFAAAPAGAESRLGEPRYAATGPDQPYIVNPPLSAATIERRKQGYWTGGFLGMFKVMPSEEEIDWLEARRADRLEAVWSK